MCVVRWNGEPNFLGALSTWRLSTGKDCVVSREIEENCVTFLKVRHATQSMSAMKPLL